MKSLGAYDPSAGLGLDRRGLSAFVDEVRSKGIFKFPGEGFSVATGTAEGRARILPANAVVAGAWGQWDILFTAGPSGISQGGGIAISFLNPGHLRGFGVRGDWTMYQCVDPLKPGYVKARGPANAELETSVEMGLRLLRIRVRVVEGSIEPYGQIVVSYGGRLNRHGTAQAATYAHEQVFKVLCDNEGNNVFRPIAEHPSLRIVADSPQVMRVVATSTARAGEPVSAVVAVFDKYGNVATSYTGNVKLALDPPDASFEMAYRFTREERGVHRFENIILKPGVWTILCRDEDSGLEARSNPVLVANDPACTKVFWGDIHGHTNMSDGRVSLDQYYCYARDLACLDFSAATDHDFLAYHPNAERHIDLRLNGKWELIKRKARDYYEPGRFVTFPGFEWTGGSLQDHLNVYYLEDDPPIFSHVTRECDSRAKLFQVLKKHNCIVIPHHTAYPSQGVLPWRMYDPELEPVVEIYSRHGSSECAGDWRPLGPSGGQDGNFVQDALACGCRFGFIAGSDDHRSGPGGPRDSWEIWNSRDSHCCYPSGLTAVLADELTREAIFSAIRRRRCYATSGARILVDFKLNGAEMGEELEVERGPVKVRISAKVLGTDVIDRIEVLKNNCVVYVHRGTGATEEFSYSETTEPKPTDWYYLRVTQRDDERAWTSPVWVSCKAREAEGQR